MGALGKFEKGMENAVASVFSRAFHSDLKPVEIVSAIKRAMDDNASAMNRERTIGPNHFVVEIHEKDLEAVAHLGDDVLTDEMAAEATAYATEQDYTLLGPVVVTLESVDDARQGAVTVHASIKRGAIAPVTSTHLAPEYPIVEIGADRYLLTGPVTIIGRGAECDITIDDTGISRRHLELRQTPGGVIATDLGSTNGTFVENHRITAATLVDGNTITVGRTHIMFWNAPEN